MVKKYIPILLEAVYEASIEILNIYKTDFNIYEKPDRTPVTLADQQSSEIILKHLKKTNILAISEEAEIPDYTIRKNENLIWLVDPIDGTKEFIRKNGEFCICIALIEAGKPVLGLIAQPTEGKILIGGDSIGAYYFDYHDAHPISEDNQLKPISINKNKTAIFSRSGLTIKGQALLEKIENKWGTLDTIQKGSALKFVDLSLNNADFYPRMAPTMEWDIAAGQAIYTSLGGEVIDFINFAPLNYNKENLYNPFFIAKNKDYQFE
ncbi:3'(2'),5'-bisphosphate nucleotidase CysQ family protein [Crocinitomix catalasitica]|uniref:3'(2'),5'-bisphosphate nucleotidase CysQ family protein n=1 Tax=Crocinitomix catalasitica TaxID=184607 RepID=UPI00047F250D|nr:inositol monophosphatase family protein [Crocinitomix catalasitica]